jgi:hypothetical protein
MNTNISEFEDSREKNYLLYILNCINDSNNRTLAFLFEKAIINPELFHLELMNERDYDLITSHIKPYFIGELNFYFAVKYYVYDIANCSEADLENVAYKYRDIYYFSRQDKSEVLFCHIMVSNVSRYWALTKINV